MIHVHPESQEETSSPTTTVDCRQAALACADGFRCVVDARGEFACAYDSIDSAEAGPSIVDEGRRPERDQSEEREAREVLEESDEEPGGEPIDEPLPESEWTYPSYDERSIRIGAVMPDYGWSAAYDEQGESMGPFGFQKFHNHRRFAEAEYMLLVIATGWCQPCQSLLGGLAEFGDDLRDAGVLPVYLLVQDRHGRVPTSRQSNSHVHDSVGTAPFIRLGEADHDGSSAIHEQFAQVPQVFVIRRSDMRVVVGGFNGNPADEIAEYFGIIPSPVSNESRDQDWEEEDSEEEDSESEESSEAVDGDDDAQCVPELAEQEANSGVFVEPTGEEVWHSTICSAGDEDILEAVFNGVWRMTMTFGADGGALGLTIVDLEAGEIIAESEDLLFGRHSPFTAVERGYTIELEGSAQIIIHGETGEELNTYDLRFEAANPDRNSN